MKFLFNIENPDQGSEELKDILGFIDATVTIDDMKTEIEDASLELRKIIGKPTYDFLVEKYEEYRTEDDDYGDEEIRSMIRKGQAVVGNHALMMYAPKADLAFTNNGRLMRSDEHHKSPFEWMIERYDEKLERAYYSQIDYLIELLDENNPTISASDPKTWKETDSYKNSFDVLFRTTEEFNEYFRIDSRYLLMKLAPGIKKVKREEIVPRLTQETLDQYLDALKEGDPVPNESVLKEIKTTCAYLSLSWAIHRMSATLFPEGVMTIYLQGRNSMRQGAVGTAPQQGEVGVLTQLFQEDGNAALKRLEDLLREPIENPEDQPVYSINIKSTDKFIST